MQWYKWLVVASIGWGGLAWAEVPQPPPIEMPETVPIKPSPKPETAPKQPKPWMANHYRVHGDNTVVTDTKTGLMWKRCAEGQSGENCSGGKLAEYDWDEAMAKFGKDVSFAGYSDWRIPTREELRTLVYCSNGTPQEEAWGYSCDGKDEKAGEYQRPTINQTVFPNTPDRWFWSSSPYASDGYNAWYVYFNDGYGGWYNKVGYSGSVRLLRGRQ